MQNVSELIIKPVGQVLQEAGLINEGQLQVALMEQGIYKNLKLGEILALHGWVKQETADFFGEQMHYLIEKNIQVKIGNYFHQAGLLSQEDINDILTEQQDLGIKFGSAAVLRGCLKQETLEFFLKYFVWEKKNSKNLLENSLDPCKTEIADERDFAI